MPLAPQLHSVSLAQGDFPDASASHLFTSCGVVGNMTAVLEFASPLLILADGFVVVALMHVGCVLVRQHGQVLQRTSTLQFISIASIVLEPFKCFRHPNRQ